MEKLHTSEKSSAQSEQMLELTVLPHIAEQEQDVIEHVDQRWKEYKHILLK